MSAGRFQEIMRILHSSLSYDNIHCCYAVGWASSVMANPAAIERRHFINKPNLLNFEAGVNENICVCVSDESAGKGG